MQTKTTRAPLALALAALFAASLVPVSGADSPTTHLYTFAVGSNAPDWTVLKLRVEQAHVSPSVYFETPAYHCPASWGVRFIKGPLDDAQIYNGLSFSFAGGNTGALAYTTTPITTVHQGVMVNDGAQACTWVNMTVNFGELPVGIVHVLHITAGSPFTGTATMSVDGPGVSILGVSSGNTSFWRGATEWGRGVSGAAYGPPSCGAPWESLSCPQEHHNEGGSLGLAYGVDKQTSKTFKNRPYWIFTNQGTVKLTNASVAYPTGEVRTFDLWAAEIAGMKLSGHGFDTRHMNEPSGQYTFYVNQSANAKVPSMSGGNAGWHLYGADVWFPDDVRR